MKQRKQVLSLFLLLAMSALFLIACGKNNSANAETDSQSQSTDNLGDAPPDGDMPMPDGGNENTSTKVSVTEGNWSFDVITTGAGENAATSSTITYYAGKSDAVVIVPSVLGGAPVTEISSQAFGHHSEIMAVYVPDSVTTIDEWAFYDLNTASILSFANPDVAIDNAAFQSCGNAVLYLPSGTSLTQAGGKTVVTDNTEKVQVGLTNSASAAIAGGTYLNVTSQADYTIDADDIAAIAVSASGEASDVTYADNTVTFSGDAYVAKAETIDIYKDFTDKVTENDITKTLWYLTADDAESLNETIDSDSSYKDIKSLFHYEEGYYINGSKVTLDDNVKVYNIKTGETIEKDSTTGNYPSTGTGLYKYMTYEDTDNDGDVDILYYSPYNITYSYNATSIKSDNENLNGLSARDILNPIYLSFANAVLKADGKDSAVVENEVTADTAKDGDAIGAANNEERSILWATNYGTVTVDKLNATSTSKANWGKMSYLTSLSSYNVEIAMEWGMNALLYATNGGVIKVGNLDGGTSTFYANGDAANGIIAGGSGTKAGSDDAPSDTSSVYVYNSDFNLEGWNNHVADVVYGGYAYLEKVNSTTGVNGSYSVGQASAIANDFGNGVVDVKDFNTTVYGNRSAGAYVIGGGVITADHSNFVSKMDAGLVAASGGTFKINDSSATGQIGLRNRGGINTETTSELNSVSLIAEKDTNNYTTGEKAAKAVAAWTTASGSAELMHYMMSDADMTIGKLCENYNISDSAKAQLLTELSSIAGITYSDNTLLRNSVLDNTYYNYSAGQYTGTTDYSDIPYLTIGSSYGGLVSSVMEFESAGINLSLNKTSFKNANGEDYQYLIASESGSAPIITFTNSDAEGIIWNEGDVTRMVEGRNDSHSSALTVTFDDSDFTGSFADGSSGLWNVDGLSYTDGTGSTSSLNGNYYGAQANWGSSATFTGDSTWTVTHDSYLGNLTIKDNAKIVAASGYKLTMTVNGTKTDIAAGTYSGKIVFTVEKQ